MYLDIVNSIKVYLRLAVFGMMHSLLLYNSILTRYISYFSPKDTHHAAIIGYSVSSRFYAKLFQFQNLF
jgi:hypothetical protein